MAPLVGLRLRPTNYRAAWGAVLASVAVVTALIVLVDAVLFRAQLPPADVAFFVGPDLPFRIVAMMVRAVGEDIAYRLVVMTGIVALGGLIWRRGGKAHPAVFVVAILIAQLVNILPKLATPTTAPEFARDVLRFYLPGLVWGWLYWRHGFVASMVAHPLTHVVFQPLLLLALRA